jgi:hypothetical protein
LVLSGECNVRDRYKETDRSRDGCHGLESDGKAA